VIPSLSFAPLCASIDFIQSFLTAVFAIPFGFRPKYLIQIIILGTANYSLIYKPDKVVKKKVESKKLGTIWCEKSGTRDNPGELNEDSSPTGQEGVKTITKKWDRVFRTRAGASGFFRHPRLLISSCIFLCFCGGSFSPGCRG